MLIAQSGLLPATSPIPLALTVRLICATSEDLPRKAQYKKHLPV
jgi:transcriptional regulator with AAA-type ATPase domain